MDWLIKKARVITDMHQIHAVAAHSTIKEMRYTMIKLEQPWRECFRLAWESFRKGSIPIGAVVTDQTGRIVGTGRSQQFESSGNSGEIYRHKLSHAELNALLQFSQFDHPDIHKYTLYATVEPCPLCFGALVMSNVRALKFASRDRYAGSTNLVGGNAYIQSKNIMIEGPFEGLEYFQTILNTVFELKNSPNPDRLLDCWKKDCPDGVKAGMNYYKTGMIDKWIEANTGVEEIFDNVMMSYKSL